MILRATWPEATVTAGELLERVRSSPPLLSEEALARIETAPGSGAPARDKSLSP